MNQVTVHNLDRYMSDLRQILSQGKKRIGLLIGAGAPVSLRVNNKGEIDVNGGPLIPDVSGLTSIVLENLKEKHNEILEKLKAELETNPNIESILTRVRQLSEAIGSEKVYGYNGSAYKELGNRICEQIGSIVAKSLPANRNSFDELVSWIGDAYREHPIEVFTPNYDLLLEEAFERAKHPYFDGFAGSYKPFFDAASISDDNLSPRWSRLWKIHGSLGWDEQNGKIIRTGDRRISNLIYPEHLKYDQITRHPFSALFERLRWFLNTPDSLLLCSGFSFSDAHITAVLDEALFSNPHTAVIAFQFRSLENESYAIKLASLRHNLSVYASDGAVINRAKGKWVLQSKPNDAWESIRNSFCSVNDSNDVKYLLGDFEKFTHFCKLAKSRGLETIEPSSNPISEHLHTT